MLEQKQSSAIKPKLLHEGMKKGQMTELDGRATLNVLTTQRFHPEKQVGTRAKTRSQVCTAALLPFLCCAAHSNTCMPTSPTPHVHTVGSVTGHVFGLLRPV